jgi:HlyD family secretion protein
MTTSFWPAASSTKTPALRWYHFALLAFVGLLLAGLSYTLDRKKVEVRVTSPGYQTIESTISTSGTVTPIDDFSARANFSGVVEKIYVHLGQRVRPGQMLVLMKDQYALSRVLAARAALESSKVNEENVENNGSRDDRIGFAAELVRARSEQAAAASAYATLDELEKRGSVSHAEVLAGSRRLQDATAALQALQQRSTDRYSRSDAASWKERVAADKEALAAEKVSYGNAHITSPIAGTVYLLPANQYDFVPAGSVLLQVADLNRIHVRANFDEVDVGNLQVGEPVTLTWDGKPGQSWSGHVVEKPLAVTHSDASNVGSCTIDIDNPKNDLPVGTNVIVIVTVEKHEHVLTIPREALHSEGTAHYVYRVHEDKLVKTPVNLGIVNPLRAEITSGLEPRDVIALNRTDAHDLSGDLSVRAAK